MLKSCCDTLRAAVTGPLMDRCGAQARMLTAEVHGDEVRGLAVCARERCALSFSTLQDASLAHLANGPVDLLRLTRSSRNRRRDQQRSRGAMVRPFRHQLVVVELSLFERPTPHFSGAPAHRFDWPGPRLTFSSLTPGMMRRRQSTTCWKVFTLSSRTITRLPAHPRVGTALGGGLPFQQRGRTRTGAGH